MLKNASVLRLFYEILLGSEQLQIEKIRLCPGFSKRKARGIFGKSGSPLNEFVKFPASIANIRFDPEQESALCGCGD